MIIKRLKTLTQPPLPDIHRESNSQGIVATRSACGGMFVHEFVTNFLLSLTVKEFRKSVNIW